MLIYYLSPLISLPPCFVSPDDFEDFPEDDDDIDLRVTDED